MKIPESNNKITLKARETDNSIKQIQSSDVVERPGIAEGVFKTYMPEFLYKPPFGYPRNDDPILLRQFGKMPYLTNVKNLITEDIACAEWSIVMRNPKAKLTPKIEDKIKQATDFLNNPNSNKEGFSDLIKPVINDLIDFNTASWNKIFTKGGDFVQLKSVDGASILLNPDVHGNYINKADLIFPDSDLLNSEIGDQRAKEQYGQLYLEDAAYFQYGLAGLGMPIPFGKKEIVFFKKNVTSDNPYGYSIVQSIINLLLTLNYGSKYNLDFYTNNNMPDGVLSVLGMQSSQAQAFQNKLANTTKRKDSFGIERRVGFKFPVVNVEAKFTPFQMSSKDMEIISQQEWFTKLVWSQFGISPEDMGFNDSSNKSVSETVERRFAKKVSKPFLKLIADRINAEIISELDPEFEVMFEWNNYDINEELKKFELCKMQIEMGVKTAEMIAEENNFDVERLTREKEEAKEELIQQTDNTNFVDDNNSKDTTKTDTDEEVNADKSKLKGKVKDMFDNTELEEELVAQLDKNLNKLLKKVK